MKKHAKIICLVIFLVVIVVLFVAIVLMRNTLETQKPTENHITETDSGSKKTSSKNSHEHNFGEWTMVKEAKCTEEGSKQRVCSTCSKTETEAIPALGHSEVEHEAKSPTCTEIGWDAYVTCKNCDYTTYEEKPALGQNEDVSQGVPGIDDIPDDDSAVLDFEYTLLDDGTYEISRVYSYKVEEIIIPSTYEGKAVTQIGEYAFTTEFCDGMFSVTIPDSVTSIGSYAFRGCSGLISITIPDSVTSIGNGAFLRCDSLMSITIPFVGATKDGSPNTNFGYIFGTNNYDEHGSFVPSSLKTVVITGGTTIDESAFVGCDSLTSVTLPDSVTSIGEQAFVGCDSLTSITIPDSVTSIGYYAFSSCSSLTSVAIGNSVTSIGDEAFFGCSSLTSVTIPDSVTSIGISAFYNTAYYNNESNWENDVLYIGNHLIDANNTISDAYTIKDGTKTIANEAFKNCSSLTSIEIPDSVTSIGYAAFIGCSSLTSITISDSVTSIGDEAFYGCYRLTDIYFTGTEEEWNAIDKSQADIPSSATIHFNYVPSES